MHRQSLNYFKFYKDSLDHITSYGSLCYSYNQISVKRFLIPCNNVSDIICRSCISVLVTTFLHFLIKIFQRIAKQNEFCLIFLNNIYSYSSMVILAITQNKVNVRNFIINRCLCSISLANNTLIVLFRVRSCNGYQWFPVIIVIKFWNFL